MHGADRFYVLLDDLLMDDSAVMGAILGRVAQMRANGKLLRAESSMEDASSPEVDTALKAAHAVATCISAILCAGLREGDPQVPYWWTFDAIESIWLESYTRAALESFLAVVTLCRGGIVAFDAERLSELLEVAFASLPAAVDAIIDRLDAQGASPEVAEVWEIVAQYISAPELAAALAHDLGLDRERAQR